MRRYTPIAQAETPDGTTLTLSQCGSEFLIRANGKGLMSSDAHGSEEALATLGCARAAALEAPVVLVGGLGMGYTLRATLDALPTGATVVVAELLAEVVAWNRGPLGPLAGRPLEDPRVVVDQGDVADTLRASPGRFDAVLLDVDNGPLPFSQAANADLYADHGLAVARAALAPGGLLAVWSAWDDRKFEHRLRHAGFTVATHVVRARLERGGPNHTIFIGAHDGAGAFGPKAVSPGPSRRGRRAGGRGHGDGAGRRRR